MRERVARVTYDRQGHVGTIALNRPDKRNALNPRVWDALDEAIALAEQDAEARVVLLRGEGKSFCAGLDLSPDNELFPSLPIPRVRQTRWYFTGRSGGSRRFTPAWKSSSSRRSRSCRGTAWVPGWNWPCAADIRLCSEGTLFALPEARLAFISDIGGLQRLTKVVGPGYAREISFRAHQFDSRKAQAIHLVNEVYPDEETLLVKSLEMAEEIAGNPPLAVQGAKEVFLFDEEVTLEESLEYNAARSAMVVPSEDMKEAITAYLEKRKGTFKGA